jgi:hypothetical protein
LAVFIDVTDGELKLKDVFGDILPFSSIVSGGGGLNLQNDALITSTLTPIVDKDNTSSALSISTEKTKIESSQQCPLEVESTGVGGGIALLDNTTTNNTSVGIGALGDNLCFRAGGDADGNMRLHSTGNLTIGGDLSDNGKRLDVRGTANITERVTIEADSTATTQTTAVIQAIGTNSGIALVPNGTGAITADIPDGTATGGVSRGTNAVDFQMSRTDALQSAAGNNSNILGGINNRANRLNGSVLNGNANNSFGEYSVVLNGTSNTSGAFNNNFTTVINGTSSNATVSHSIASGNQSNATGSYAIALGDRSTASEIYSFAINGTASGVSSFSFAGTASETRSYVFGAGNAYLRNMFTQGAESFQQTVQSSNLLAYKFQELTSATSTILSLDGTGVTNLIIPPFDRTWNVRVKTVARVITITGTATGVSVGDSFMENQSILFKRVNGVSSIVGLSTDVNIADLSMATASMTYTAGASQELDLTFTAPTFLGGGSLSMRVVSNIELVEVG